MFIKDYLDGGISYDMIDYSVDTIEDICEAYLKHRVEMARERIEYEIADEIECMAFDRETQCMNDAYHKSIKIVKAALKEIEG